MLAEFGEQLIIIDPHNFLQRVDNAFSEKGYEYIYSKVNYDDYSKTQSKESNLTIRIITKFSSGRISFRKPK
ncbi:hypothetical protein KEH51_29335 [[Brevibacterium] frigoritolerans]|uniref:Uncharacterized protein n=1 Tax=Peribacillus frigoritolerans TaxID=450367 RepID=A0A941FKL2_9BACI|nr:hypothetical protein [Peribacillus frigoritolerans]